MKAGEHPLSQKPLYTCQDMWEMWDAGCSYAEGADAGYPQASKKFQNAIKEVAPYTSVEKIQELEETISALRTGLREILDTTTIQWISNKIQSLLNERK